MLYGFGQFIFFIYFHLFFRVRITGKENLPFKGSVVLCANHMSLNDPLVLGSSIKRPIHFLAKQELFKTRVSGFVMRGINAVPTKRETADMSSFRAALAVLEAGDMLGIFVQGHRIKELDAKDAKAGAALYALKSGAEVVPVKITSTYRIFSKIYINIGSPVDLTPYRVEKVRSDLLRKVTDLIVEKISAL